MAEFGRADRREVYLTKLEKRLQAIEERVFTDKRPVRIKMFETKEHLLPDQIKVRDFKDIKTGKKWGRPGMTAWFELSFIVPAEYRGAEVHLLFDCGGNSVVFMNNEPLQGLDEYHSEVQVLKKAAGGEKLKLYVEAGAELLWGRYKGPYELKEAEIGILNREVRELYYDLNTCHCYVLKKDHKDTRGERLLDACIKTVDAFNLQSLDRKTIERSAAQARKLLAPEMKKRANASEQLFSCSGHGHIDVAWLWTLEETKRKCARTFSTVLKYMDEYPEYIFTQSQPQLYEYTKERYPKLYSRIRKMVRKGQWEPAGAMWVEADCNLSSGESLVRQILFGTRFFKKEFDLNVESLWLPDVFGYAASLPQILKKSGIDYFMTTKISWNQFTDFPYNSFWWEGIDGTKVLSHFPPSNTYNGDVHAGHLMWSSGNYSEKAISAIQMYPFGHGDGGGGPSRDHIERVRRYCSFEGIPRTLQMKSSEFFKKLEKESENLPEWMGELYLEKHRGTYTTQADNKKNNRKCEFLLRDAELLSSWSLAGGGKYPSAGLAGGWKKLLLNQFHDIIPGSSINEVYKRSDLDYAEIQSVCEKSTEGPLKKLLKNTDISGCEKAAVVFNTLSWERKSITSIPGVKKESKALSPEGIEVPVQSIEGKGYFCASVPSMGYAVHDIRAGKCNSESMIKVKKSSVENRFFRIRFDTRGNITSISDKRAGRNILSKGKKGNLFRLFEDKPNYYDAWDLDVFCTDKLLETPSVISSKVIASGPVAGILEQERRVSNSLIKQRIWIYNDIPRIDFRTVVEWGDEKDVLLKVSFPFDIVTEKARYEIQFGNVERPVHSNRKADMAMFEVCGHKWADLSEGGYGVSLLNDCRYGHSCDGSELFLTLLRAPKYPDPEADVNKTHAFTYSLFPHEGDYAEGGTVHAGYDLNVPLISVMPDKKQRAEGKKSDSFLSVDTDDIIIETVKKCEDRKSIIVRLYESRKRRGRAVLTFNTEIKNVYETDLMENRLRKIRTKERSFRFDYRPFEIKTFELEL